MARASLVLCVTVVANGWLTVLHSTVGLLFGSWLSRGGIVRGRGQLSLAL